MEGIFRLPASAFAVPFADAAYDYVVVGGGTSGLAIAARLAKTASVAVVEAGGIYQIDNGNQSVVPAYAFTQGFTSADPLRPGKTLGGSSVINNMAYHRATVGYHDKWAELVGDESYGFNEVLPYFKQSTHHNLPDNAKRAMPNATVTYNACVFGDGPIEISYSNHVDPRSHGQCSGHLAGYGAWNVATMTADAKRSSGQDYLVHAIKTTNLMAYPHTQVTKILFDAGRATGVTVKTAGIDYTISANKEVIVSAGAFHTPQLLMVSGVGPSETLEALDIPVVADLPGVGQNLQDQIFFDVMYGISVSTSSLSTFSFEGAEIARRHDSMFDQPIIDLGWLSDPADAEVAVAIFKRARAAWETSSLGSIKATPELVPGAAVSTDEDILNYIKGGARPIWHASGTCKMGKADDELAVVDSKARVYGVEGLRVVDASVLPIIMPGHPMGTLYMLAEKIAAEIQAEA
ncbi:unnamed protein product [Parascedosporium putredinis]|uniref:Glucose-methanol-choline oxidoreductase N-terminal domain-containing protein n=2 Tax=Parascedosporium putredinis TaxID=1442378 RepID=A0A9P1MC93_9PEZI|nr:unnamed protein product [Parascedosporium putredinis]CAI7996151.1 unnamed protein product [Parascedosporium putredinis]